MARIGRAASEGRGKPAWGVFISLLLFGVSAQAAGVDRRNIRFHHVSIEDGLSQNTILSIVQDRDGLMWFGTQEGLNRYDGYTFTVFAPDPNDPTSLRHSSVRTLLEASDGTLWVGTDGGGLNRFDRLSESFESFANDPANPFSLSNDRIRVIYETRAGALWVGTDGGLNRLNEDGKTFTRLLHNPSNAMSLSHDHIRTIHEDRDGSLWVGTDGGGINVLDPGTGRFRVFRHDPADPASLSSDRVRVVYEDRAGKLWVGTYDGGLNRLDPGSGSFERFQHDPEDPRSLAHNRVRALLEDSAGTFWAATDGGLCEWRPEVEAFVRYHHDPTDPVSLSDDRVTAIFEDRGSVLWVGTYSGVNTWNLRSGFFEHYRTDSTSRNQLSGNVTFSFAESADGHIWIGTYGAGLNEMNREDGSFTHYRADPSSENALADDRVMSLLVDREGLLWIGTYNSGLDRLDRTTGRITNFRNDESDPRSLSRDAVTTIFQDGSGVLWIGTYGGGLNRFDDGKFIRYQHEPSNPTSLSNDSVLSIEEGENGVLWIGTNGGGLNRFEPDNGTFSHYLHDEDDPRSLSNDNVWVVRRDRKSRLWVGTQGGGLNRWDPGPRRVPVADFERYTTRDGLPSGVVQGILEDDAGNLWLSTNNGLTKFDPEAETFRTYDTTHGLLSNELNQGAFFEASDGQMFFGGPNGFNAFYPQQVEDNPHVPPVVLTAFLKFNQPVDVGGPLSELTGIELTHRDSVVAFEFAALDYTAPEKNVYRYKLEGFDEDWIEAGTLRRATYTNLGPRRYTFRVKAANNDGVWNEAGLSIPINVVPPPWKTWWAYTLYGLTIAGVIAAYARRQAQRLEREAEYNRKLQREVDARTRELAQQNKELAAFNRKLEEASLTDSLTGFWNRRFLLQQIPKEISQVDRQLKRARESGEPGPPKSLLFLMFDLDGFKGLNDTFGHAAGDRVLIQVRKLLLDVCRQSDTIIRWGGDEFLLLGRNADPESAENLAERIRTAMEEMAFDVGLEQSVHLSCSIGFALYPFDRARPSYFSWEQVVGIADRALYVAKESGRNAWAGILCARSSRATDLTHRISEDLEELVSEGTVEVRDSGARRPRLVREVRRGAGA